MITCQNQVIPTHPSEQHQPLRHVSDEYPTAHEEQGRELIHLVKDADVAHAFGSAMGDEFYRKGSNVQLGPGMCLARVPRNWRNFEYISGEDPYLGYAFWPPFFGRPSLALTL